MATQQQIAALKSFNVSAQTAKHVFPQAAACECATETSWGISQLYRRAWNAFGTKQHSHPIFGTINLPTKEFLCGKWVVENDDFVKYPDLASCFADRMATLVALAPHYPHYAAALVATTPEQYLIEVSRTWATSPTRASDCLSIMHAHLDVLNG